MEIARRNIFDEIIGRAGSTYESAILTCFSFDPLYFMQYYLPKLNAINITNIKLHKYNLRFIQVLRCVLLHGHRWLMHGKESE